jgi:serine/threonine protein kinase
VKSYRSKIWGAFGLNVVLITLTSARMADLTLVGVKRLRTFPEKNDMASPLTQLPQGPGSFVTWDGYRIGHKLGEGGAGVVHFAQRAMDAQVVALKLLNAPVLDPYWNELRQRFANEAEILQKLSAHSNLVRVIEAGTFSNGVMFIAIEHLAGGTLEQAKSDYLGRYLDVAALVATVARAVAAAHSRGILHRDIQPRNLMFRGSDRAAANIVVTDFGIALNWQDSSRLTRTGTFFGTPAYAAAEQLLDVKNVTEATDVYAMGVVMFHLLTGMFPTPVTYLYPSEQYIHERLNFRPENLSRTAQLRALPPCPIDLANICHRCLLNVEKGRIATAGALADELDEFVQHHTS